MEVQVARYMIQNGKAFSDVAYNVMQDYKKDETPKSERHAMLTVSATNIHFAVELALKALNGLTVNAAGHTHDLSKLFETLDDRRKQNITSRYNTLISKPDFDMLFILKRSEDADIDKVIDEYNVDLSSILDTHKQGFIEWRYNHENEDTSLIFDYYALTVLFKVLQEEVFFIIFSIEDNLHKISTVPVNQSPDQERG